MSKGRVVSGLSAAVLSVLTTIPANAQTKADAAGLEEITVTAQRFATNLQTTPVAVTAFSETMLQDRQILNVSDVNRAVPSLLIQPAPGISSIARVVLRGVGQENGGVLFDPGVGIYIDNVYQPRPGNNYFDFFDVDRIEVLRGPQGTLYGRNTSGGALKIVTKRPSFDTTFGGDIAFGSYNTLQARVYGSTGIVDGKLAASISAVKKRRDGILNNSAYPEKVNDVDTQSLRAKLLLTPSDAFEAEISASVTRDRTDEQIGSPVKLAPGVVDPFASPTRDLLTSEIGGVREAKLDSRSITANMAYHVSPEFTINSITGYGIIHNNMAVPIALTTTGSTGVSYRWADDFFSQELNGTYNSEQFDLVGGAYYFRESGLQIDDNRYSTPATKDRRTKAYAFFGQGTYKLPAGVSITGGLRYTHEDADFTQFYFTQRTFSQSDSAKFNAVTPKAGIDWQATEDLLLYFSYTKGFKSGGFNAIAPNTNIGPLGVQGRPLAYNPEKVESFEGGVKFSTPDHRFRLNVAVFQANYDGFQLPVLIPGTVSTAYTTNATGARVRGIELEPTWKVNDRLDIFASMSILTGKYTAPFTCATFDTSFINCQFKKLKGLMPVKSNLGFSYVVAESEAGGTWTVNADWAHTDKFYNNVANAGDLVASQKNDIFNATLSWAAPNKHWTVSLEGKNITDKQYIFGALQISNPISAGVTAYVNEPRTILVRLKANY